VTVNKITENIYALR